jgi:hypothetical protein
MKFTLVLEQIHTVSPEVANALFNATGGDVEFSCCEGEAIVEVDRDAPPRQAIETAIRQVEQAGLRVARIEPYSENRQIIQN